MKRSRFTEEQIVGILKAAKQRAKRLRLASGRRMCAASTGSAKGSSTSGRPSTEAWR